MKLANWAKVIRHWIWVAPLALGVVFVASGVYMMTKGQNAKNEVRDAIVAENMAGTAHQEAGACEPVSSRYSELANSNARCTSSSPERKGIWPIRSFRASRQSGRWARPAPVLMLPLRCGSSCAGGSRFF